MIYSVKSFPQIQKCCQNFLILENIRFSKVSEQEQSLVTTPETPEPKLFTVQNVPVLAMVYQR